MTLYFSCLQECTELLVGIVSLAAFLKRLFQRWPWQTGSNAYIIFHCIFSIFLYLNLSSISVIMQIFPHIQYPVRERFCGLWSAWYHVYLFYGRLRYSYLYWGSEIYFHLQNLFLCINGANCRFALVKLKLRAILLCLFLVCSRNWCFYNLLFL